MLTMYSAHFCKCTNKKDSQSILINVVIAYGLGIQLAILVCNVHC